MSDSQGQEQRPQPGRMAAEGATLVVSVGIILLFVGLAVYQSLLGDARPVDLEVEPQLDAVRQVDDRFHLPVEVTNTGEQTAENVLIRLSLASGARQGETAQFQIHFLAGGETQGSVVIFEENPREVGVSISPVSYQIAAGELGS